MFETAISTAALSGVELHKQDGTPYWKLAFVCARKGCKAIVDECFCYTREEDMIEARDTVELYCSTACWTKDRPEKFAKSVLEFRKYMEGVELEEDDAIDWDDTDSWMWQWEEWLSDRFDGDETWEVVGADMECPI